uniref:RRM domain-containing protein n=1 Tax=Solanum lycopersicum TaxID=4081 RepID=A0A3Q7FLM5_SOLLC
VAYGSNANTYIPGEEQGGGCTGEGGAKQVQDCRIFVGGLSWDVTEHQLEDAFSPFGKIVDCQVRYFP